jgi:Carboxypeptidase regulatory-like domain
VLIEARHGSPEPVIVIIREVIAMSRSRYSCFVPVLLSILLLFAGTLWSQRTTADVVGTITDASGAVLPNVKITIHNLDTGADFSGESDKSGEYTINQLPVGRYSMKAVTTGFKTWTVPLVTLAIGDRLRQDVQLQVGNLEQSVEVTAASPALPTHDWKEFRRFSAIRPRRNVLHAPGRESLDLAIHREFPFSETMRFQFRGEAFNVTNTASFSAPGASFGSGTFGVINSAGLGRNIQLALKLLF